MPSLLCQYLHSVKDIMLVFSLIECTHIMNINDVKYSHIFKIIKTGYEYYNLIFFLIFLEQQNLSNYTKPITV